MGIWRKGNPYRRLARAVVIRAALDYVLLRFPASSRRELLGWFRSEGGRGDRKSAYRKWQRGQVLALGLFLADDGSDLAAAAGCSDVIRKVRGPIDNNRLWVMLNRNGHEPRGFWGRRKADG